MENTSIASGGALGEPNRNDRSHTTQPKTCNDSAHEELGEGCSRGLQDRTDSDQNGTAKIVGFAAISVAQGELEEGAKECSNLIRSNDESQQCGPWVAKHVEELCGRGQATHKSKIIPKKQEAK